MLLTVRSYSDETRERLIRGIERIARGEAIAAGVPDDRMPLLSVKDEFTPSTYNPPAFANRMAEVLKSHFPEGTVSETRPSMAGEDFGRYYRADKRSEEHTSELQSLMRISYAVFCLKKKN